ncbi:hypothetical protein OG884_33915 [Streptosporangium sp. NBC_01755]|uniref:hypothetical protein n=1 Tax=Streptosporangium sp. NBC_01755 TaxID=2975949 RepID=UPI002DDBDEAD|nr:hypothetical protein [Streptosporangium sp. NBC_01755]WSC99744.1 hypothetical protein OG884_33915 [Streptosporangium sp. NBC_01755]
MTEDTVFHPAYALGVRDALVRGVARTRGTIAPALRLLVPVDVRALVVRPGHAGGAADHVPIADVTTLALNTDTFKGPASTPPFTDLATPRAPGVHLHWALPDGLTTTRADGTYRPLPDRWLVTRLSEQPPRAVRSWVVEADRANVTDLAAWREPGPGNPPFTHPHIPAGQLTAVAGGEPGWAAVYDNVANRFGFHDPWLPGQTPMGPLTYVVTGWYSQPGLDPLRDAEDPETLLAWFGWALSPERIAAARERAARAVSAAVRLGVLPATAVEQHTPARPDGLAAPDAPIVSDPRPWWPRQSVYHGVVYGVPRDPDTTNPLPDDRPDAATLAVSVGATSVDAAAALIADRLADPAAEVRYAAFAYGVTDALIEPTGVTRLAEELHARAFDAAPGGERTEKTILGDPFEVMRDPEQPTPATDELRARFPAGQVRLAFTGTGAQAADLLAARTQPARISPPPDPRRVGDRTIPLPRLYQPQDPVVLVRGLRRCLRHGHDGRFSLDDRLACRLTGDTVRTIAGIDGRRLLTEVPAHGEIPREAADLVVEAATQDPFTSFDERLLNRIDVDFAAARTAMETQHALFLAWLARPAEAAPLLRYSLYDGVTGSPAGITIWQRQPWVPLYLEWQAETTLSPELGGWTLDELDFTGVTGPDAVPQVVTNRSLLTPATARSLASAVSAFCAAEDVLDRDGQGRLGEQDQAALRRLAAEAGYTDFLSAALGDLRAALLGYADTVTRDGIPPEPTGPALLLRAGQARLPRLRAVDAFGRSVDLLAAGAPVTGRGLQGPGNALTLRPRLNPPSRLMVRLVDAADDSVEANTDPTLAKPPNPVAGWLLADHADDAVEFFDPGGVPLGQLRHDPIADAVVWEGPPGDRGPIGLAPGWTEPERRHLTALARGLLDADTAERADATPRTDTPLRALLRVIETTGQTVAWPGRGEHLAQLVARPVALVRATLRLDIVGESFPAMPEARRAAWRRLAASTFPVRLGALTRIDDGLYGFVVDDDYRRLWTLDPSISASAVDSGARRGDLAGKPAGTRRLESPMLRSGTIWLRPGQTVRLTLLLDAAAKVHATSGILPRKSIELLRDWTAPALARIMPSFRAGPVLVDADQVRLPISSLLGGAQSWARRDGETSWRDDPIVAATQQALLPVDAAVLEEGYLRLRMEEQP